MFYYVVIFFSLQFLKHTTSYSIQDQEPQGIHLVYGNESSTQINIIWWTRVPVTSAIVYYSLVDLEDEHLPIDLIGCNNDRVEKGYLAKQNASTNGKYIQRVYLKNLLPNRRYCYEITSGHASSHIYSFRTASLSVEIGIKTDKSFYTNFVVNGNDLFNKIAKQNQTEFSNAKQIESLSFQIESIKYQMNNKEINGFINLPSMRLNQFDSAYYDKDFIDYFSEILSNMPILPTIQSTGDKVSDKLFSCMFPMMGLVPFSSNQYSLNINGVHFLTYSIDLTIYEKYKDGSVLSLFDKQIKLIEDDLIQANKNRHLVPWIIVLMPSHSFDDDKYDYLNKRIEILFYEYDVDLILESSTDEYYERTYPLIKSLNKYQLSYDKPEMPIRIKLPNSQMIHLQTSAVDKNKDEKWSAFKYKSNLARGFKNQTKESEQQTSQDYTYGMIEIINSTLIHWSYLHSNDSFIDQFNLSKNHNDAFERIVNTRQHFVSNNQQLGLLNASSSSSSSSSSNSSSSSQKIKFILLYIFSSVCFILLTIALIYTLIKRYQKYKNQAKINSNYSNLIESEFEAASSTHGATIHLNL